MSFDFNLDIDDLFNGDVVGFAVDAFDTFVWDTGRGAQTGKVGSIWQQGWDMVDNLWGDDGKDAFPSADTALFGGNSNTPEGMIAAGSQLFQQGNIQPQGLLSRAGESITRKMDKELESGDWVGDTIKGGAYAVDRYYSKKNREKELEKLREIEQDKARMSKHGFTGHRTGFAR